MRDDREQAYPSTFSSAEVGSQARARLIERLNERVRVSAGGTITMWGWGLLEITFLAVL